MDTNDVSAVTGSEQTPASVGEAGTTESTQATTESTSQTGAVETSTPFDRSDPWASVKVDAEKKDDTQVAEPAKTEQETPAEPEKTEEAKTDEAPDEIDQVLEEAFSEEEKPDETKDDFLDKQDADAMVKGQRNATARAWAERNARRAEPVKAMLNPTVPISEVAAKLKEASPARFTELSQHAAHELVDTDPDGTFRRAFAIKMLQKDPNWNPQTAEFPSLDDLVSGKIGKAEPEVQQTQAPNTELAELTKELDQALNWDWRNPELDTNFVDERELGLAKSLRAMETTLKAERQQKSKLQSEIDSIREDLAGVKQTTTDKATEDWNNSFTTEFTGSIRDYRQSVSEKILPHILKSTGLEVTKEDTPEIKALKESNQELYTGTAFERANNEDTAFEKFAFNESTVKGDLTDTLNRVALAKRNEVVAKLTKKSDEAAKFRREAEDEKLGLLPLLAQASKEFRKIRIEPLFKAIGTLSAQTAQPILDAAKRVEITGNGGPPAERTQKPEYRTADDVWSGAAEQAKRADALRAAG